MEHICQVSAQPAPSISVSHWGTNCVALTYRAIRAETNSWRLARARAISPLARVYFAATSPCVPPSPARMETGPPSVNEVQANRYVDYPNGQAPNAGGRTWSGFFKQ